MNKSIIKKRKKYCYLYLLIFFSLLVISCSKSPDQNSIEQEKQSITGSVIEDTKENCRLSNESDCSPIEIRRGEAENEESNNTQETANAEKNTNKTINISEEFLLSNCEAGWKCVAAKYRASQFSNCSWTSIEFCVYGCKNGTCNPPPICKQNSLKCSNDVVMKCSEDGSEWNTNESCDYHCENGICIGKNATTSSNTSNETNYDYLSDRCINVANFNYNASGPDNSSNLNDEYFTIKNSCSYLVDMTNWTAKDASTHDFIFPSFNLGANALVTIHTGSGTNGLTDLYWGSGIHIWNNDKDTLYLNISNGTSVLVCKYNLTSPPCS